MYFIYLSIIISNCNFTEKAVEKLSSDIISRLDIQLLPGQTLRVKVSNVEGVSKFHIQFASADYCNQLISSHMTNNDPKVCVFAIKSMFM